MIANVFLISSVAIFALAMLDLLLSSPQKAAIGHFTTKVWDQLDRLKRRLSKSPELRSGVTSLKYTIFFNLISIVIGLLIIAGVVFAVAYIGLPEDVDDPAWTSGPMVVLLVVGVIAILLLLDCFFEFLFFSGVALLYYFTLTAFLFVELLVRRIAEHPKGPIIAVSATLAAFIAFMKAYG